MGGLTNNLTSSIILNVPNGPVSGNFTVHRNTSWTNASITNNTSDNMIINNLQPVASNGAQPDISVTSADRGSLSYKFVSDNSNAPFAIQIQNNSGSDVIFDGFINNPAGSLTATNSGGNILGGPGNLFLVNQISLIANNGSIGSAGGFLNAQLESDNATGASLSAQAGGNLFLNATLVQNVVSGTNLAGYSIPGALNVNSIQAGGNANLNLEQPTALVNSVNQNTGERIVSPAGVGGTYNIGNLRAGGDANLNVAGVPLYLDGLLQAAGSANITDTGNSIYNGGGGQLIQANAINLSALNGQIGTNLNPVNIALTGGSVNASAQGDVNLLAPNGNILIGAIDSSLGNVNLTALGSILDAGNSSAIDIIANNINLTAGGSIGTSTNPLPLDNRNPNTITNGTPDGSHYLDMTAQGDINVDESAGNLLSHSISSTAGNINLRASNGNGDFNQLIGNENITATVFGSLLNINDITGSTATAQKMASPNNVSLTVETAGGTLNVNHMDVFQSVTTRADNTDFAEVVHTNLANPNLVSDIQASGLHFDDAGATGGLANNIEINVTPCAQCTTTPSVIFDNYLTQTGQVNASVDWLEFINTIVGTNADFQNNWLNLQLTNKRPGSSEALTPWYLFMIGDQIRGNFHPVEFQQFEFLDNGVQPVFPQPIGIIFKDLLTSYGLRK